MEMLSYVSEDLENSLLSLGKIPFKRFLKKDIGIVQVLRLGIRITSQKQWSHPHHHKTNAGFAKAQLPSVIRELFYAGNRSDGC
jgi:hypothetical protein